MTGFIKICGIRTQPAIMAAASAQATHVGFVFDPRSKRYSPPATASQLAHVTPATLKTVGLIVNARDPEIDAIMLTFTPHLWQLHGDEPPERVIDIRTRTGRPVIKAIGIASASDLDQARRYEAVADFLLLDAKAPADTPDALPGGMGRSFDWTLLAYQRFQIPWFLAGGLNSETVGAVIRQFRPNGVDVSSGVELSPGEKDATLISEFCKAARAGFRPEQAA